MSSTTTKSARRTRPMALLTLSSARCRPTRTPSCSRVNQATFRPLFDGLLTEGFEQERLPRPGRPADHQVLAAADPLQCPQCLLGRRRDGAGLRHPGIEGLPGRERRRGPAGRESGPGPTGGLLGEQRPENLSWFPPLGLRGRQDLRGVSADVREPQPPQQCLQILRQWRRGRDPHRGWGDRATTRANLRCRHRRAGGGHGRTTTSA